MYIQRVQKIEGKSRVEDFYRKDEPKWFFLSAHFFSNTACNVFFSLGRLCLHLHKSITRLKANAIISCLRMMPKVFAPPTVLECAGLLHDKGLHYCLL